MPPKWLGQSPFRRSSREDLFRLEAYGWLDWAFRALGRYIKKVRLTIEMP